jgi:hypothetical protein
MGGCAVSKWEYCELENDTARKIYQAFYSSQERADNVDQGLEQDVFVSWRDALAYLGDAGWEAFYVDAKGSWYFKRSNDEGDTDWADEEEREDGEEE